jgi:broad specificity phosphatase PhoE
VTLWWVRHGPTHAKGMVGWSDLPADLSDRAAIARLSAHLPKGACVTSSDLARARQTADAIAQGRPRLPDDPDLREIHFGAWELRRHDEIEAETPDQIRAFWERPGPSRPPGGESWDELSARVSAAADRLARRGGDIVVVAHFGAILCQYQRALGLTPQQAFAQPIDNLSVTRLQFDGSWRVACVNHRP